MSDFSVKPSDRNYLEIPAPNIIGQEREIDTMILKNKSKSSEIAEDIINISQNPR